VFEYLRDYQSEKETVLSGIKLKNVKKMSRTSDGPFDNHVLYQSLSVFVSADPPRWKKRLLNASDSFLSLFVITPLVISHWRGSWEGMNLFPRIFPGLHCMILGAVVHFCLAMLREPLHSKYNSHKSLQSKSLMKSLNLYIVKKIYTYVFSMSCILHW
jgi:Fuseless